MAHRMYLYNLGEITPGEQAIKEEGITALLAAYEETTDQVCLMMEWGYELPLLLQPLFAGGITIQAPVYNGTEGGLYAPAAEGIAALKALYNFIERHQAVLVKDTAAFMAAKERLFAFLDNEALHPWFHLDAWDVFNMSDDGSEGNHQAQAAALADHINRNNAAIRAAIAADNPALLDACPVFREPETYFTSFRQLLNDPAYDYGWEMIASVQSFDDEEETEELFVEGGLYGLKGPDGALLLPAVYEEVNWLSLDLLAIKQGGKWGLADTTGKVLLPPAHTAIRMEDGAGGVVVELEGRKGFFAAGKGWLLPQEYSEIYALQHVGEDDGSVYLVVKQQGKTGLFMAGVKNRWALPVAYENVRWVKPGFIAYRQNKLWGLARNSGELVTPALYASVNGKTGLLRYGAALGFTKAGVEVIGSGGAIRALTAAEAAQELKDEPRSFFTKAEMAILQQVAAPVERADKYYRDGVDAAAAGDYGLAITLFEKAVELGHITAMTELGYTYETAEGFTDYDKAFAWYQKAADKGEEYAMNNLGLAYWVGKGTPVNLELAEQWLLKAAEKENAGACTNLGELYYREELGMRDLDKSLAWFWKAYLQKEPVADFLGSIYEQKGDYSNALFYYNESARQGSDFARERLEHLRTAGKK